MIYQPQLRALSVVAGGLSFKLRYRNQLAQPGDPEHDESHIHSCYEIYFNLSGDVSFWVNNRLYPIKSGDIIVTKPGDVHLCVYHSPSVHEHFCLWLDFGECEEIEKYAADFFSNNYYSLGDERQRLLSYMTSLKEQSSDFMQAVALFDLISYLCEKECQEKGDTVATMPPEMQKIVDDINENFAEISHVGDIFERHYISRATLNRRFRKYLHVSPHEFLEAKKLSYAKKLLSEGYSVTEACMRSGFSDCSYFISVFKKKFGSTPLKYKK